MITHPGTPVPGWDVPPKAPQEAATFKPVPKREKPRWAISLGAALKSFRVTITRRF
jgi:hypothetical protein